MKLSFFSRFTKMGYDTIIQLHDVFTIQGPNGFHECLVTEVVVPIGCFSFRDKGYPSRAIMQLLKGFAFLHAEGWLKFKLICKRL